MQMWAGKKRKLNEEWKIKVCGLLDVNLQRREKFQKQKGFFND